MSSSPWWLPAFVLRRIDALVRELIEPKDGHVFDFAEPAGEAALFDPDSVGWRVFRNPVALYIGGLSAVILELAEPSVRTGVWEHSSFRSDPARRLQRTGMAAMVTVYGARSKAEAMIRGVVRMHERVAGTTPGGAAYRANDVRLLTWVQATASFGFSQAYSRWVCALDTAELDRLYAESAPAAQRYGAVDAPRDTASMQALFDRMRGQLEPSPIVGEFLDIMRRAPVLPLLLRPLQGLFVRAAIDQTPDWVRERLDLPASSGLRPWQRPLVRLAGRLAERIVLPSSPAAQSCRRLGLPPGRLVVGS